MSTEIARELGEFITKTKFVDIPEEIIDFTKALVLKTVSGILRGSHHVRSGRRLVKFLRERGGYPEVGVMGTGFKASLWNAVLAHAFFAHASELEDDRFDGGVSWDITVLPITLSLAQKFRLSGKDFIEASAIGLEVHVRTCQFTSEHLGVVMVPGAVGPAAAAAKILGLSTEETMSALGLALSGSPSFMGSTGTDEHYLDSALYSLEGIISAEFAREGFSSNPDIATYLTNLLGKEKVSPQKITKDIGEKWLFHELGIKKYPCCFFTHRHIDALLELINKYDLSYDQIDTVEVHIGPMDELCNRPNPKTVGDLQFSYQHVLSAAILDRDVNFDHITEEKLYDPKFKEVRAKVKIISHPERPRLFMSGPAIVNVRLRDGREYSKERTHIIGSIEEPLNREQLEDLYRKFTRGILPEGHIERTAHIILNLEKFNDMDELMDILTFRHKITLT